MLGSAARLTTYPVSICASVTARALSPTVAFSLTPPTLSLSSIGPVRTSLGALAALLALLCTLLRSRVLSDRKIKSNVVEAAIPASTVAARYVGSIPDSRGAAAGTVIHAEVILVVLDTC